MPIRYFCLILRPQSSFTPCFFIRLMNVFILSTGRCGSTTIVRACEHITNYSTSHESRSTFLATERLNYPDHHIESDNRLSWFLGQLDQKYGNDAFYVHLTRERVATTASYARRWNNRMTIVRAFGEHILMRLGRTSTTDMERLQISSDYYDAVNANIELFLKDKTQKMHITLENMQQDFQQFWTRIGAEGDLAAALETLDKKFNSTASPTKNRTIFVPKRKKQDWGQKIKVKVAYKIALYWTNYYFRQFRK